MRDMSRMALESTRPTVDALEAVEFCLTQLYAEQRKKVRDEVVHNLTYEELVGALLLARDVLRAHETDEFIWSE